MRQGIVLFLAFVLIGLGLQSFAVRDAGAFASPLPTLEPAPFRATPTGWPSAPFPWQAHRVRVELRVIYDPGL